MVVWADKINSYPLLAHPVVISITDSLADNHKTFSKADVKSTTLQCYFRLSQNISQTKLFI